MVHADCQIPFFRVDLSEQCGELWEATCAWLGNEVAYGGNGALVWLRNGEVYKSVSSASEHSINELLTMTTQALKT